MENNKIYDGGSAFPFGDYTNGGEQGMSLRDWFAGMALQGFAAKWYSTPDEKLAKWSYNIADAMLAARNKSVKLETELNEMRSLFTSYVLCEEAWRNESTDNKVNAVMEANFMREKAKQLLKL